MQKLISQIVALADQVAAQKEHRTVHLDAALGQLRAAGSSLSTHCAALRAAAAEADKRIQNLAADADAERKRLEAIKAAAADANAPAPAPATAK